jgi:Tfp pilus assembly protein PilF
MAYLRIGQLPVARRELEKATQLEPDNAAAHYQLGRLYTQIHALDLAKTEFDRTAELQSTAAKAKSSAPNP